MKIIHCADLHLDSKLESNLPPKKSNDRKKEIVMAFHRMVDYAVQNGVEAIIIAGDLFDTNRMQPATKDIVLGKITENSSVKFYYLCGNHDDGKSLLQGELPQNLYVFSDRWIQFELGNVVISGVELTEENRRHIYGGLMLDRSKFNIVTLHGDIKNDSGEHSLDRKALADKGIDYLALGHFHSFETGELGKNGMWCYCGCLEGRGFDEHGDKGFVLLDIADDKTFKAEFVKNSRRDIVKVECDLSGIADTSVMLGLIDRAVEGVSEDAMVKVELCGRLPQNARKDVDLFKKHLDERFWFVKVKDLTGIELKPEDYVNDISLKGEFIRKVMAEDLPQELRDRVIECGLAALSGQEVQ